MVEIAICLAIIGIALVAIIGVLPIGINVQKDNRQETLIDQDAAVLMENIRNGARGLDDLTNYVTAITNYWTEYNPNGAVQSSGANSYSYSSISWTAPYRAGSYLTNGANIIGLLTTPKYTDPTNGAVIPDLLNGGISNHVVAWVRCISGPAVEKPPQTNADIVNGSFSYKVICDNVPAAVYTPPTWLDTQAYAQGDQVLWDGSSWQATAATAAGNMPGVSALWARASYPQQLAANLHELRLTFLWPLLPNGNTGNGRHTFATTVAGQVVTQAVSSNLNPPPVLYFFDPQTFSAAP